MELTATFDDSMALFEAIIELELEGVVAKRERDASALRSARRTWSVPRMARPTLRLFGCSRGRDRIDTGRAVEGAFVRVSVEEAYADRFGAPLA